VAGTYPSTPFESMHHHHSGDERSFTRSCSPAMKLNTELQNVMKMFDNKTSSVFNRQKLLFISETKELRGPLKQFDII
jgi:hypothetical protein